MTYNVVDQEHGVVQVEGEVMEIEGVQCGVSHCYQPNVLCDSNALPSISEVFTVTELRTGAKIGENTYYHLAIRAAGSNIRSVEFGPAMVRTKTTLERMGIEYPVNDMDEIADKLREIAKK